MLSLNQQALPRLVTSSIAPDTQLSQRHWFRLFVYRCAQTKTRPRLV